MKKAQLWEKNSEKPKVIIQVPPKHNQRGFHRGNLKID